MDIKEWLKENFTNVKSIEDLKYVDRRILIVGGSILFVLIGIYYYYLIAVYLPHKQAVRDAQAAQAAKQQAQVQKATAVTLNAPMTPSSKVDAPQQGNPKATDIFKVPSNYMDISKIAPADSAMYLNTFDVLYDYLNQVFQGNYQTAFDYLNKDFVKANNITLDSFSNYYKNTYFTENTFFIYGVSSDGSSYTANVTINDKEHAGAAFNATYKLVNNNGKYSIILDDLASYNKLSPESQQKGLDNTQTNINSQTQ